MDIIGIIVLLASATVLVLGSRERSWRWLAIALVCGACDQALQPYALRSTVAAAGQALALAVSLLAIAAFLVTWTRSPAK